MENRKRGLKAFFMGNMSYKLVALVIAVILWLTILGRRDYVISTNVPLDFLLNSQYQVVSQSTDQVALRISGPRQVLNKFAEDDVSRVIFINLRGKGTGTFDVPVPVDSLDLPFGAHLVSVKPRNVVVQVEVEEGLKNED